jgi:hypothetical protein
VGFGRDCRLFRFFFCHGSGNAFVVQEGRVALVHLENMDVQPVA